MSSSLCPPYSSVLISSWLANAWCRGCEWGIVLGPRSAVEVTLTARISWIWIPTGYWLRHKAAVSLLLAHLQAVDSITTAFHYRWASSHIDLPTAEPGANAVAKYPRGVSPSRVYWVAKTWQEAVTTKHVLGAYS